LNKTPETVTALFERAVRGGYLRFPEREYRENPSDPVVSTQLATTLRLRGGERVEAVVLGASGRPGAVRELVEITAVEGENPKRRTDPGPPFSERAAVPSSRPLRLSTDGGPLAMRIIDLFMPIGYGQRALIVAPPRTGKTILFQQIAHAIAASQPSVEIVTLLIDERPEEVTDMKRNMPGSVVASSNDLDARNHVRVAELFVERAKRVAERGKDVVILVDSLTRLARASNHTIRASGRVLTGGLEARALERPKRLFGAARCFEMGGSLTLIGTVLVETGSAMDDVIASEFRGAANVEIQLSTELAQNRIWPAIDIENSAAGHEEYLLEPGEIDAGKVLRKKIHRKSITKGIPALLKDLRQYDTNAELVAALA